MRGVLVALAEDLRFRGAFHLHEAFIDGSFAPAKKGAQAWARPSAAKEPKSWQCRIALGFRHHFDKYL
jgi:hypothetical protein